MDIQKEREAFQKFCEENFDFERHEQTYFDEQTQCYENDIGEDTESINMAWSAWQAAKAQADQKVKLLLCDEHLKKCESPTGIFNSQYPDEEPCLICLAKEAKAQAVPKWVSTSDRMPEEGEEVLVHSFGQVRQVTRDSKWAGGFKERNCYGWQAAYGQSHWMPKSIELPEQYHFYYENDAKQKAMIEAQEPAND